MDSRRVSHCLVFQSPTLCGNPVESAYSAKRLLGEVIRPRLGQNWRFAILDSGAEYLSSLYKVDNCRQQDCCKKRWSSSCSVTCCCFRWEVLSPKGTCPASERSSLETVAVVVVVPALDWALTGWLISLIVVGTACAYVL